MIFDILNASNRHSRAETSKIAFSDEFLSHGRGTIKTHFSTDIDNFNGVDIIEKWAKFASHKISQTLTFLIW